MLLSQDLCGCHQRRLAVIVGSAVSRCRSHHGFAAAHVALNQPVHRSAFLEIPDNFIHSPLLGTGEGKGQTGIEGLHVQVLIGGDFYLLPGSPHQGKTCGKNEEFFKNQPFFCHFRLGHAAGLMDGKIGPVCRQDAVALPDLLGDDLRRRIADGQSLSHRLQDGGVGQPCCQRIQG